MAASILETSQGHRLAGHDGLPAGKAVEIRRQAIEIVRRQFDDPWKFIGGDPKGRG